MAEIKIEKKKQIWPWIITGLIILALLLYFRPFGDDDKNAEEQKETVSSTEANQPDLIEVAENNDTVVAYVNFVDESNSSMSLDHAYTNEAFSKLIAATEAMATEVGYDVQSDLDQVREYARMITIDPFETTHADNIRKADDMLTIVLQNIQKAKYPELVDEVTALQTAAESIQLGVLTLDQKDAVKNYFEKASDLLQKMN
jgi:hypothetical protein